MASLIEITDSYEIVYRWFDYLKIQNHHVVGYVIMPNHIHVMISFSKTEKIINKIIGDGKRFMAYEFIKRLEQKELKHILEKLEKAVTGTDKKRGKKHEVWEESFDWKFCETEKFANQKLVYMHNNPCAGKWKLVIDATKYEHSSARFYISGKHAAYEVKNIGDNCRMAEQLPRVRCAQGLAGRLWAGKKGLITSGYIMLIPVARINILTSSKTCIQPLTEDLKVWNCIVQNVQQM